MGHATRQRAVGGAAGSPRKARVPPRRRAAGWAWALGLAAAAAAGTAWSQERGSAAPVPEAAASQSAIPPARLSVEVREAATNNTGLDDHGLRQGDFITSLRPELDIRHKGAGVDLDLDASAMLVDYAKGSQPDGILPDVRGALDATLIPRWLKVDVEGYLRAAESDPFGVRTDDVNASNRRNQWALLAGPTLQHDLGSQSELVLRHQFGVMRGATSADGDAQARLATNLTLLRLERKPTPVGGSAEFTRLDNRLDSSQGDSRYTLSTGRLRASALVGGDTTLALAVGQDRSEYLLSSHVDPLYGASLDWSPGARTHLALEVQHRYFGESGRFHLDHRTPYLSLVLDVQRQLVDAMSSLGTVAQGADVRSALNAILATRYPDPATRAGVVDNIVASRGLDTRTAGAIDLVGDYPQLQTAAQATVALLGVRDTLSLSAYSQVTRVLARDGDPLVGGSSALADNRQRGAAFQFEHRLAVQLSATLSGNWSRIEGLGANAQRSAQQTWRLAMMQHLSPRSDVTVALQWYRFETTAIGQRSFDATLGLVGLSHRF